MAVRKAGIRCPRTLVVGGGGRDIGGAAAAGVLSTFYVLMEMLIKIQTQYLEINVCK